LGELVFGFEGGFFFFMAPPTAKKPKTFPTRQLVGQMMTVDANNPEEWWCICTEKKSFKQARNGYTNLLSHLNTRHIGWQDKAIENLSTGSKRQLLIEDFVDSEAQSTMRWLKLLITKNLPLSYCDDKEFIDALNPQFKRISIKTLKKRMFQISSRVEKVITEKLTKCNHIALVFDGWSERGNHYLAIYAAMPQGSPLLLAFAPFLNEEQLSASEHIAFADYVLDLYKIDKEKIACLIGDNCNTNKAFAMRIGVPFIGCASHRLNLAIKHTFLDDHNYLIKKVNTLMVKLGSIKRQGKYIPDKAILRNRGCAWKPVKFFPVRWSGAFNMIKRYCGFHSFWTSS
jgi:hypothetical protein